MSTIQVPAVRFTQNGRKLFMFAIDGKLLHSFARVPHVGRDVETGKLDGFQRPEVRAHIKNIREYIETGDHPILPNAVVLAFDKAPKFVPATDGVGIDVGIIHIPDGFDGCADIVDGQQRTAAIRDADVESFPVAVVGFVAENESFKREQFMRVNSSRPLPRQFIMELLPGVDSAITAELEKKRVPAIIIDALNNDHESPLLGLIKTATSTGEIPGTVFADGITKSLASGALYNLRGDSENPADTAAMVAVVSNYWKAVGHTFKDAWKAGRKESRITFGGPIGALMALMDEMAGELPPSKLTQAYFKRELALIVPVCHWTADSGNWDFDKDGVRTWDALDNGTKGIGFLSSFLVKAYRRAKVDYNKDVA